MTAGETPRLGPARIGAVRALLASWLTLDFFADARRRGEAGGATLTTTIFGQASVAFVFAALVFDDRIRHVPFAAANLTLASLLVAFGLFAEPPRGERRIADRTLVDTAPRGRTVRRLASILHGTFFVTLIALGVAIPSTVLTLWVTDEQTATPLVSATVHLVAALACAGITAGAVQLVLSAATAWASTQFAALTAGTLRALIVGGGFAAFALGMRHLDEPLHELPFPYPETLVRAWPPWWGARWAAHPHEWWWPACLVGTLAALFAISALLDRVVHDGGGRTARRSGSPGLLERMSRALIGARPRLLGVAEFTARMLLRSPGFRARVLPLFGLPAAMAGLATLEADDDARRVLLGAVLQFPAIYLPFLILFLPEADQPRAAHVFRTAPGIGVTIARSASLVALTTRLVLPMFVVAALALPFLGGVGVLTTASMVGFALGLAVLVAGARLGALHELPFTRPAEGSGQGGREEALGGLVVVALVLAGLGGAQARFADTVPGLVAAALTVVAGILVLRWRCRSVDRAIGEAAAAAPSPTDAIPGPRPAPDPDPGPESARTPAPSPLRTTAPRKDPAQPAASLRRELLAVTVLYGFLTVLPIVVGLLFR